MDPDEADDIDTWMCNECTQKYGGDEKTGMWFVSFMLCMSRMQFGYFGVHDDTIIVRKRGVGLGYLCFVISQCYSPFTLSVNLNTESVSLLFPLMSFLFTHKREETWLCPFVIVFFVL